ncbi:MAG: type II toxin-antitoxin system ParD family antitoxin [Jaaginema sp. PMC 1079.18]|nr:type II toxin-antitoxin system ParD family antitoxin [Jaaginema sp. PMC 1080.18]MEC4851481.1 type II toxin-antitoxin system ParD family antitoxin [Jaaginema sp. PMC 1079.18]MEC4867832.1 type II toxin-antitoxin system ParD family antitoxin [Jaaginema sp. PMC 1078.18]
MKISLPPEFEQMIQEKIASGHYNSPSEVVQAGLILLQEKDMMGNLKKETLRREIQKGIDSGESIPFDIEQIKAKARQMMD